MSTQDIPTTGTDWRALCAELHQALEKHCETLEEERLLDRSAAALRAALAQPEPELLTDEAPEKDAPVWYNSDMASSWEAGRRDGWSDAIASYGTLAIELAPENVDELVSENLPDLRQNLETVIRCSRAYDGYSTMTPIELADRIIDAVVSWHPSTLPHQRVALAQPEPVAPTDEALLASVRHLYGDQAAADMGAEDDLRTARAVLARWCRPAIQPVPVTERPWEREGWCNEAGWCWGFDADDTDPCWIFDKPETCICWTHCLPAHALPILTSQEVLCDG
jgi:hypothetical protein